MKPLKLIAVVMALLVISLPIVIAQEYNLLYDANGNVIYDEESNVYRIYNEMNQLSETRVNNATGTLLQRYIFDPIEERVFVKDEFNPDGSIKSSTIYFGDDYVVVKNASGVWNETYIYLGNTLVGIEDANRNKKYVLTDHEGSTDTVLDSSGNVLEQMWASPFGEVVSGGKQSRFNYESREYSELTEDTDFRFRKYKQDWGRFLQGDTFIQNVYDPQSLNRYMFERGNPYKYTDPDGHNLFTGILVLGFIAFAITAHILEPLTDHQRNIQTYEARYEQQAPTSQTKDNPYKYYQGVEESDPARDIEQKLKESSIESYDPKDIEVNIDSLDLKDITSQEEKEGEVTCVRCYTRLQVDEKGQPVIVTFNQKGQEVSRKSSNGSKPQFVSDFMPDPSGRKDRFGNSVYVPKPRPPKPPKPKTGEKDKKT